jgi:hypothetical protein
MQSKKISGMTYRIENINKVSDRVLQIKPDESYSEIVSKLTPFFNELQGSSMFWKKRRQELLSMINSITLKSKKPTIFLTLSAADTYWPELFDKLGIRDHQKLTYQERNRILSQNPKLATQMFKKRFESLLDILLDSKLSPIGKVEDYWFRIEFQQTEISASNAKLL